mmetsp:Transcript_43398/g.79595  ORF Transcript_43398/g.79595 Transcript_43398/m.79595 type:complete len:355 (+) Transcript_43398:1-1065(+)
MNVPPQPAVFTPRPPVSPALTLSGSRKRGNDLVDEDIADTHFAAVPPLPCGLRTPQRSGYPGEDRASKGARTPARTPQNTVSPSFGNVETPEAKKALTSSPPSGPAALQRRLEEDIDSALDWYSIPLLNLALRRGHCCAQDHMVFEAVRRQNTRALRFLLESGDQDVDQICCGKRPLHHAMQACIVREDTGYRMSELLLQHGANPNARPQEIAVGLTSPLQDTTRRGCIAGLELLLRFKADLNAGDKDGLTPMHILAQQVVFSPINPHKKALSCLLANGANPFVVDARGHVPLDRVQDKAIRCELIDAMRWWTRRSISQLSRMGGELEKSGTLESMMPWILPEIFEAILSFLCA